MNIDEMRAWLILNEASEGSGGISGRRGTWMCEPVRVPIASYCATGSHGTDTQKTSQTELPLKEHFQHILQIKWSSIHSVVIELFCGTAHF